MEESGRGGGRDLRVQKAPSKRSNVAIYPQLFQLYQLLTGVYHAHATSPDLSAQLTSVSSPLAFSVHMLTVSLSHQRTLSSFWLFLII